MKALSIRQPWAWLIVNGFKDVENRDWSTNYRGEFLIHASKGMTRLEYLQAGQFVESVSLGAFELPPIEDLDRGGIVGSAVLTTVFNHETDWFKSPWFTGEYGFLLGNVKKLPFRPCKGRLKFFEVAEQIQPGGSR